MTVEEIARAFVAARRAAIDAKGRRNVLIRTGHPDPVPDDGYYYEPPCWKRHTPPEPPDGGNVEPIPESEWCNWCQRSKVEHDEYRRQARKAAGLLRRMENATRRSAP